jgi:hypothetical protein
MEQYELNWKNYYDILGIGPGAEPEVIKAAYTALARKYHPDTGGSAPRMKEINESYEVLSDPQRKACYDIYCRKQQSSSATGNGARTQNSGDAGSTRRGSQPGDRHQYTGSQSRSSQANSPAILPWPSLTWQRVALFCSIPLGMGLMLAPFGLWFSVAGFFILIVACFASIKTRGLSSIGNGWTAAKVSAGFCITSSLCVLGAVVLLIAVVFITVVAIVTAVSALTA